jgi:hypothetical protein
MEESLAIPLACHKVLVEHPRYTRRYYTSLLDLKAHHYDGFHDHRVTEPLEALQYLAQEAARGKGRPKKREDRFLDKIRAGSIVRAGIQLYKLTAQTSLLLIDDHPISPDSAFPN